MVDALHEAHRVLRQGGLLIDARPDSRRLTRVWHMGDRPAVVGTVGTERETLGDDRASDRAIALVRREGLFRGIRAGGFTYRVELADLAGLRTYLEQHGRLVRRARWTADAGTRRAWQHDPFAVERYVRYELLERL